MKEYLYKPETHEYFINGARVPSVTQVLPYNFYGNESENKRLIGQYVHRMIELHDCNNLDEDTLHPVLRGYLKSYKLLTDFRKGNPVWKRMEQSNYLSGKENVICDYKTGVRHPCNELQLAGYYILVTEGVTGNGNIVPGTYNELSLFHPIYLFAGTIDYLHYETAEKTTQIKAIYLKEDGSMPQIEDYTKDLGRSTQIFLSFLTCYKWRKEKNISWKQ